MKLVLCFFFFFQAEDGIRDDLVTGVQTCALPICRTRPFLLGFHRRVERRHRVLGRAVGDLADRLLGGRVDHVERRAARGVAPLTSDVELVLDLLDYLLFLCGDAHVATVSVPSSSDMATSIEYSIASTTSAGT